VPEEERRLRRRLLDRALEALQTPVAGPTVFDPADTGEVSKPDAAASGAAGETAASGASSA
jgi:hypothetical protein